MKITVPNLKKILKPVWSHKPGFGMTIEKGKRVYLKQDILEQGTTPKDKDLLKKLGIKKGEKILVIAGYYASWASALKKAGVKVDYSDVSKSIVSWVKKNVKTRFGKYIISNYELVPKNSNEYDWTFTYEACGGGRGLPIAYLRSLLNKKGGILILQFDDKKHITSNVAKVKRYPLIVKNLARIYGVKSAVMKKRIFARRKKKPFKNHIFLVSKIFTNSSARKKAEQDLKILDYTKNKKIINLEESSKRLRVNKRDLKSSLMRLNKLSKAHIPEHTKTIEIR